MSSPEQRREWERLAWDVRQGAVSAGDETSAAAVDRLVDATLVLAREVDWLRAQLKQRADALEMLRGQRQRLALRLAGFTNEEWEDVLASVGVEPQTPRDPRPTAVGSVQDA
jgi:hypothetical protein